MNRAPGIQSHSVKCITQSNGEGVRLVTVGEGERPSGIISGWHARFNKGACVQAAVDPATAVSRAL